MAEPSNYPPLSNPISVVGAQFCSPYPVDLAIAKKILLAGTNYSVADIKGKIILKVKPTPFSLHGHHLLLDANDNPLLSMQNKIWSMHLRWQVFRGASTDPKDLLFSVKQSSILQAKADLDVFLANNTQEQVCDFKIKGSWLQNSCKIYIGDSTDIIAEMHEKITVQSMLFGKDNFMVTVNSNIDYAFIAALIVLLDAINQTNNGTV